MKTTRRGPLFIGLLIAGLLAGAVVANSSSAFRLRPAIHDATDTATARLLDRFQPISAASGDFDGDGVPDLVCGFTGAGNHFVALHRGNIDSIFPHRPEARARRAAGTGFDEPFHAATTVRSVPVRPDFLATGDFDGDGPWDVVLASREGTALYLLPGDGSGGFGDAVAFPVEGPITAFVAGEVNRADGIVDLVVGVHGASGPAALVFEGPEGALRRGPERLALPAPADALALGRVVSDWTLDLLVAADEELLVFEGRDRRLASTLARQAAVPAPTLRRVALEDRARAIAVLSRTALGASGPSMAVTLNAGRLSRGPGEDLVVLDGVHRRLQVLSAIKRGRETGDGATLDLPVEPLGLLPMRLNQDARTDFVVLEAGGGIGVAETTFDATITVNSRSDAAVAGDGACTLREAIANSNADSDTTGGDCAAGSGSDLIAFSIGGGGTAAGIALASALPEIDDPVTIDGDTQGCADPPCIELDGSGSSGMDGLKINARFCVVRGLAIHDFDRHGIWVESGGIESGTRIEGNTVGLNRLGTAVAPNGGAGVYLLNSRGITIGGTTDAARNVLSANDRGIQSQSSHEIHILGNFIGTDASGSSNSSFGNAKDGIRANISAYVQIGGTEPGSWNVISANGGDGVGVFGSASSVVFGLRIWGNLIGTDVTGSIATGNSGDGVEGRDNLFAVSLGGTTAAARNIISGNGGRGVSLAEVNAAAPQTILGNYVGTDITGSFDLGNAGTGILVGLAGEVQVGGVVAGAGNLISGNGGTGLGVGSNEPIILGNRIGTDVTGMLAIPNAGGGIGHGGDHVRIGGTDPGAGNLISGNGLAGLAIGGLLGGPEQHEVLGNFIGVDATGLAPLGNGTHGIQIQFSGPIDQNIVIGGTSAESRNVISGNLESGIYLDDAAGILIQGNYIGVDVTGTSAMGNGQNGIALASSRNILVARREPPSSHPRRRMVSRRTFSQGERS